MWKHLFLWIMLLGFIQPSIGQKHLETTYDIRDGVPQSQITALLEDEFGYLWLGSNEDGLTCFNGTHFQTYTQSDGLLSNNVLCLERDSRGGIWIGGSGGVSHFNGRSFKAYEFDSKVQQLVQFYDTLLCLDQKFEITKIYDNAVLTTSLVQLGGDRTIGIYGNEPTCYYSITFSNQLFFHDKTGARSIKLTPGLKLFSLHFVNGKPFVITDAGTFVIGNSYQLELVEPRINFPIVLLDDEAKTVWRKSGTNLERMVFTDHDVSSKIYIIGTSTFVGLKDNEGIIWIGTNGNGLIKHWPSEFEKIEAIDGLVTSVLKDGNVIWVGTKENGLYILENDQLKRKFDFSSRGSERINSIRKDNQGKIWLATDVGLATLTQSDKPIWYTRKDGLHSDSINDIAFDNKNQAWLTFKSGNVLNIFDGQRFNSYRESDSINSGRFYKLVYAPELSRMFVASDNSVLYLENSTFKRLHIPGYDRSSVYSMSLYKKNQLIIGYTVRGITLFNLVSNQVKHYGRLLGWTSIYFVGSDPDDNIWVGNDLGIDRLALSADMEVAEHLRFGKIHDATNRGLSFSSYFVDDNEKYIGLSNGLYRFEKPVHIFDQNVHLQNVELFFGEEPIRLYSDSLSKDFQYPINPSFPNDKNHLTFSFLKVNKLDPDAISYKYYLEGFENQWGPPTNKHVVTYSNLPPGKYTFKILTRDKDGLWVDTPLEYGFEIEVPLYKANWFIATGIVFLVIAVFLIFYLRLKYQVQRVLSQEKFRQEENAKLRKEIGRDFHDEMGNQLARIINYTGLVRLNKNNIAETLIKIEESAKDLITGTKDFIWALDPVNEVVSNLFAHVRDFGARLYMDHDIEFRPAFHVKDDMRLPYGYGRQINLILKESLTNAYKHSHASHVDLIFSESEGKIMFEVVDDGIGVSNSTIEQSEGGISNIVYRATKMKSELRITKNDNGIGTRIKLIINVIEGHGKSFEKEGSYSRR